MVWSAVCIILRMSGKDGPCTIIIMSSAKTTISTFATLEIIFIRSLIIMFHRVGPDTEPWVVKTLGVHCHSDLCRAAGGHSAGCRTSWVCVQHHATVVTSNGVTVCGSKFPPTVSKCSNINTVQYPKPYQLYEIPTIPAVVISKLCFLSPASWQPLFITTADSLLWCLPRPASLQHS